MGDMIRIPAAPSYDPPRAFFVTVRDGDRTGFLLGPFDHYDDALANVERGKALALAADPWAHFYAFGTCRAPITAKPLFATHDTIGVEP